MTQIGSLFVAAGLIVLMFAFILFQHPSLVTLPWALGKHAFLTVIEFVSGLVGIQTPTISYVNDYFSQNSYTDISYSSMAKIEEKMYLLGGWIPPLVMIGFGISLFLKSKPKYVNPHTFETLLEQETLYWRFNRYLVKVNPFDDSFDMTKGKFRMAEQPMKFLRSRQLLTSIEDAPDTFDRQKGKQHFIPTLGNLINGLESFSENEKLILAIFLAVIYPEKGNIDKPGKKLSFTNMEDINREYAFLGLSGDVAFSISGEMPDSVYKAQVKEILDKCWDCPYINEKLKRHAFTSTFIRGIYLDVKRGGVFPPSYVSWMKMFDRNLFYNLQTVGVPGTSTTYAKKENQPGKTMEVAMIIRHYTSERIAQSAIPKPEYDLLADDIDAYLERRFEMQNGL